MKIPFVTKENGELKLWSVAWIVVLVLGVLLGIGVTAVTAFGKSFDNKVLPGIHVGDIPIGGMTETELGDFLENMNGKLVSDGIEITNPETNESIVLYPPVVSESDIIELMAIDTELEVNRLMWFRKRGNAFMRGVSALITRATDPSIQLEHVQINKDEILEEVREELPEIEQEARNANIIVTGLTPTTTIEQVTSTQGVAINTEKLFSDLFTSWSQLELPKVTLSLNITEPTVAEDHVAEVVANVSKVLDAGPLTVTYTNPQNRWEFEWELTKRMLATWLEVQIVDESVVLGLSKEDVTAYIEDKIKPDVDVEPVEAKFSISEDQKVEEFRGSRAGVEVVLEDAYAAIQEAFLQRNYHDEGLPSVVPLPTSQVEPTVKTGEVNDLGITEVLGSGYSNFAGSPPNRVKNVRFALEEKLEGLLIKPGETFSMLDALRPFTISGGYLPELVIKGNEIVPEVGGGLCQVGSTMFRAAMNSGLPIVERRNHSLVVSYYNDHRNGLPGTDATIYDSAPDFKFQNDTGNYILITTDMNEATGDLWFTLWGTGTGKRGYYTEPIVEQWIPAGERRVTKTTELSPGQLQCQGAHNGAVTSFTYVIEHEDGTKEEREFRSHYRPLPEICLLGATQEEIDAEKNGESVDEGSEGSEDTESTEETVEEPIS
jgi:vancomycin resistance protein YoaR